RNVEAPPAEPREAPRQIRVLAIEKEVRVEVSRRDPRVLEGGAAIEAGRTGRPRDRLLELESAGRGLSAAPAEGPPRGGETDAGGVEKVASREVRSVGAVEPPRSRPEARRVRSIEAAREDRREVALEPAIRVERENVAPRRRVDAGIHRGRVA